MRHYTKILIRENARRLSKLVEFRELIIEYFNNHSNTAAANAARKKINRSMNQAHSIVVQSGTNPVLTWRAPPTAGGYSVRVDLIANIFNLDDYFTEYDLVLDLIDRSIGMYESNAKWARFRIFNPFYYIRLVFDFISRLPFIALGKLGANKQRLEMSKFGRLIKRVLYLIQVVAALIGIYQFWDFWTPIKNFVRELAGP